MVGVGCFMQLIKCDVYETTFICGRRNVPQSDWICPIESAANSLTVECLIWSGYTLRTVEALVQCLEVCLRLQTLVSLKVECH